MCSKCSHEGVEPLELYKWQALFHLGLNSRHLCNGALNGYQENCITRKVTVGLAWLKAKPMVYLSWVVAIASFREPVPLPA